MKNLFMIAVILWLAGCADGLGSPLALGEPRTYEAQVNQYGFGLKLVDAYYLPESSAGTRMVATIEVVNESETGTLLFNLFSSYGHLETRGAGILEENTWATTQFNGEFESAHSWCRSAEIPMGGSLRCSLFFFKSNVTFTANAIAARNIRIEGQGLEDRLILTTDLSVVPRQL